MNDEQYLLANAYLDGELTAEERRIAEADPEVMTEVEQLRALQRGLRGLRDVPMPTVAAREAAISAAMTEFAGSAADKPAAPAGAPVVPFRPRPAYAKYLGIAAAFVAVAGLGVILAQGGQGDDDSSEPAADVLDATAVEGDGEATASEAPAAADSDVMLATDDAADAAEEAAEDEFATEPVGEATAEESVERVNEDTAEDTAESTGGAAEPSGDRRHREVPGDFDPQAPITNDVELGVYGAYLIAERDAGRLPSTPNQSCVDAEQILDEATLRLGDELVPVYIDVRETNHLVAALHADTCAELMRGSLDAD